MKTHAWTAWHEWRRPLAALAVLVVAAAIGLLWLRRDPRRLVLLSNGIVLLAADTSASFFADSAFVVHPGEGDAGAYPVRVAAWYHPKAATVSEQAIMRTIASVAADHRGARLTRIAGGALQPDLAPTGAAPWVSITMDYWQLGDFRMDVVMHCRVTLPDGSPFVMQASVSSSRGVVGSAGALEAELQPALRDAMRARCRGEGAARPKVASAAASIPAAVPAPRSAPSVAAPPVLSTNDRAQERARAIARLVMAADDRSLVTKGGDGLRGVAVGVTRGTVRAVLRRGDQASDPGASASFVIKVIP